jgi:hypothetical protein
MDTEVRITFCQKLMLVGVIMALIGIAPVFILALTSGAGLPTDAKIEILYITLPIGLFGEVVFFGALIAERFRS